MAKSDLKAQLTSLLTTTWMKLDTVREVVVRQGKAARVQLDVSLMRRRRKDVLAEIGKIVVRLAANGKLDEAQFPELSSSLVKLEALDERIAHEEHRARATAAGVPVDREEYEPHGAHDELIEDDDDEEEYASASVDDEEEDEDDEFDGEDEVDESA